VTNARQGNSMNLYQNVNNANTLAMQEVGRMTTTKMHHVWHIEMISWRKWLGAKDEQMLNTWNDLSKF
jgi:hypothetical protein